MNLKKLTAVTLSASLLAVSGVSATSVPKSNAVTFAAKSQKKLSKKEKICLATAIPTGIALLGGVLFYLLKEKSKVVPQSQNQKTTINDIGFEYNDETLTISGQSKLTEENVDEYLKSVSKTRDGITKVVIKEGITSIDMRAFHDCTNLTSVNIPKSVTSIDVYAFGNCTKLTSVNIPESVNFIGMCAFVNCTNLTSVNIPKSVTSIDVCAFVNCTDLKEVTINGNVRNIHDRAFGNCTQLEKVTINGDVRNISPTAFSDCSENLTLYVKNPDVVKGFEIKVKGKEITVKKLS